jgi:hypothetical protein
MDLGRIYKFFANFTLLLSVFLVFSSCGIINEKTEIDPYYISGSKEDREKFKVLFHLLKEENGSEGEFAVTREIAASLARLSEYEKLIHFLNARTIKNPSDPYNGYYYMMIAYAHIQRNSEPIAALYFDLILKNYPDLVINDESSIHLVCLKHLIEINNIPERQAWYYNELITRFPEKIDLGTAYFMLGLASEQIGDWNGAIAAFTNYLPFTGTIIPGFPNADQYAKQHVDYSRIVKDWTFESLPALRAAIEAAIDAGNPYTLMRYQAKANFFARSWEQMEADNVRMTAFNLSQFMYGNRIRYAATLDASSNANEAFLRTTGWSVSLNVWYLYFRKINFPQDPEIHGRWEWAGIYYGEKF